MRGALQSIQKVWIWSALYDFPHTEQERSLRQDKFFIVFLLAFEIALYNKGYLMLWDNMDIPIIPRSKVYISHDRR